MIKDFMKYQFRLFMTALALVLTVGAFPAEVESADFKGEDKEMHARFLELKENGTPEEFYEFAEKYGAHLKKKGYMMIYYKLKNNEGFYALRRNMILRAMQAAQELDEEIRKNNATQYIYLATGLMGDIYAVTQNRAKAEEYFTQALVQVGEADPKFTMRTYQSLAELLCVKDSKKALEYANESLLLSRKTANVEYQALALAMMAYVHFLNANVDGFNEYYEQYINLRSTENASFSHRYDNMMEIARLAMNHEYIRAEQKLREGGVRVDSSLVGIRIVTLENGDNKSFQAVKGRFLEMDSVRALMQNANLDQMALEQRMMEAEKFSMTSQRLWISLIVGLILIFAVFYVLFHWMHRRVLQRNLSKGTTQEPEPDMAKSEVQVNAFCREVLSDFKKNEGKDFQVRFSSQLDNSFTLTTQPDFLRQVLTYQLCKAVRQAAAGYVMLRCEKQNGQLALTVSSSEPSYTYTISCAC